MDKDRTENQVPAIVNEIGAALTMRNWTMATAESCTGGMIAAALTALPGSSDWFEYGLVTYGNNAKHDLLEVPEELIDRHGAVSREVAIAMADGAQRRASAAIALAVTGVAGPDGGTVEKPVGTVWFAWSVSGHATTAAIDRFDGDRQAVRQQTVLASLTGALERIRAL